MPIIEPSAYIPPLLFRSGHLQTIFPTTARRVAGVSYARERVMTPDGDFLDLDWAGAPSARVAILVHGLEGCSRSKYILGMARAFTRAGWEVAAMNMRGCSGEPNKLLRSYHSGATDDLECAVRHALTSRAGCTSLALVGFSLGGNVLLKFLGEQSGSIDPRIKGAAAFSVPCDLESCALELAKARNAIYMRRFLQLLRAKISSKKSLFPEKIDMSGYGRIRSFREFDDRFTAPLHGFRDAKEYWRLCSSRQFLERIRRPTLLVNALDDPFLGEQCYPRQEAARSEYLYLETPRHGGHAGFVELSGSYWSERRAVAFLGEL